MFSLLNTRTRVKEATTIAEKVGKTRGERGAAPARSSLLYLPVSQAFKNFGSNGSPWHVSQEWAFLSARFSFDT